MLQPCLTPSLAQLGLGTFLGTSNPNHPRIHPSFTVLPAHPSALSHPSVNSAALQPPFCRSCCASQGDRNMQGMK